jgi:hypothetical protein
LRRRGVLLEAVTIAGNVLDGIVAVAACALASSVALIGFGIDTVVESASDAARLRS